MEFNEQRRDLDHKDGVIHQELANVWGSMQALLKPSRRYRLPVRPPRKLTGAGGVLVELAKTGAVVSARQEKREAQLEFCDLIVAVGRDRDRRAYARLFEHFAPRIKRLMLQFGAPPACAEEIAQDAMLAVWEKARLFDPAGASPSGWIFRISKNLHLDALRRDQRFAELRPAPEPDEVPQPDAIMSARDTHERVRDAMTLLSAEQLRVITLSFFEEKAHAEIAKELGIPLGTVKSRVRLAMQKLRELLDGDR
ncbi:MAG: sigma-70 family RNA polymerase sigma factor [Hyphomicrobiaceae bacterium]